MCVGYQIGKDVLSLCLWFMYKWRKGCLMPPAFSQPAGHWALKPALIISAHIDHFYNDTCISCIFFCYAHFPLSIFEASKQMKTVYSEADETIRRELGGRKKNFLMYVFRAKAPPTTLALRFERMKQLLLLFIFFKLAKLVGISSTVCIWQLQMFLLKKRSIYRSNPTTTFLIRTC